MKSQSKTVSHSAGPWKIQDLGERTGYPNWHSFAIRTEKENVHLATVGNIDRYFEGKELANATLMAAAPELLAACQAVLSRQDWPVGTMKIKAQLTEAVNKATASTP